MITETWLTTETVQATYQMNAKISIESDNNILYVDVCATIAWAMKFSET